MRLLQLKYYFFKIFIYKSVKNKEKKENLRKSIQQMFIRSILILIISFAVPLKCYYYNLSIECKYKLKIYMLAEHLSCVKHVVLFKFYFILLILKHLTC